MTAFLSDIEYIQNSVIVNSKTTDHICFKASILLNLFCNKKAAIPVGITVPYPIESDMSILRS